MNLLEYIKMSYLRPNKQVLKELGASDDLIAYLMETPGNTNIVIANQLIGSSNETDEGPVIIDDTPVASDSVILDDVITLVETPTAGIYATLVNTSFVYEDFTNVPETIIAEIGGQTLELPHVLTNFGVAYGEMEDDWGSFNTYPIWVWINEDGSGEIGSNTYSGEQHIKLMFPNA